MATYQFHVTELDVNKWDGVLELTHQTFGGGVRAVERRISTHERITEYYGKIRPEDTYSYFLFLAYSVGDHVFEVWAIESDADEENSLFAIDDEHLGHVDLDIRDEEDPFDEFDRKFVEYTNNEEEINDVSGWTTLIQQGSTL